ncbi:MAG: hypothetical protein LBR23_07865 [Spirochaetaceae bacterium]|jgi:hypothetical protein|nr:hypothetical protein [Spirochaetaceae bacterium]
MTVREMARALGLTAVHLADGGRPVACAYTSDLLSDVMGNAGDGAVLITIQAHKNTAAVAVLKESPAVIICNNRSVPEDFAAALKAEGISLFVSAENQFTLSGKLYALLHGSGPW